VIFAAAGWVFGRLHALRDRPFVEQLAREVMVRPRDGARATDLGYCLHVAGIHLMSSGERDQSEAVWGELRQLAAHTHDMTLGIWAEVGPGFLAFLDGRFEEAIALLESVESRARELGVRTQVVDGARLPFYLGRGTERALDSFEAALRPVQAHRARVLALLGRHDEAHAIRERFANIGSDEDESSQVILLALFEAAILGSDSETARALSRRLAPVADRLTFAAGFVCGGSIARLLGEAAVLLGQPAEARAYYQQALEVCARVRFRPEIAITRLRLAELLLAPGLTATSSTGSGQTVSEREAEQERAEALEHLDFAIDEFRAMKMQPYLERALRHKGLLHA
jgi:tetratricopeptide (TPR) repeat protein